MFHNAGLGQLEGSWLERYLDILSRAPSLTSHCFHPLQLVINCWREFSLLSATLCIPTVTESSFTSHILHWSQQCQPSESGSQYNQHLSALVSKYWWVKLGRMENAVSRNLYNITEWFQLVAIWLVKIHGKHSPWNFENTLTEMYLEE